MLSSRKMVPLLCAIDTVHSRFTAGHSEPKLGVSVVSNSSGKASHVATHKHADSHN